MKNSTLVIIIGIPLLLSGCVESGYQEATQVMLSGTLTVFLIALGLQYLFFRLWKLIHPELTLSWLPNIIFGIVLLILGSVLNGNIFDYGIPLWFLTNDEVFYDIVLIAFMPAFLTTLCIVTRVWLFFDRSKVFTWATIVVMSLSMLSTLPVFAGATQETLYGRFIPFFWFIAGMIPFVPPDFGWPGTLTILVSCILLIEILIRIRQSTKVNENPA